MPRIIFLNGPPRSGKDHAVGILRTVLPAFAHMKLSRPLKAAASAILNSTHAQLDLYKDGIHPAFGMSYREMQIQVFQQMALVLGESWLGRCLVDEILQQDEDTIIVSDCGRACELIPIIRKFGASNCALIQIVAPGTIFDNDIRGYINSPGIHSVGVFNDKTKNYNAQIIDSVLSFLA